MKLFLKRPRKLERKSKEKESKEGRKLSIHNLTTPKLPLLIFCLFFTIYFWDLRILHFASYPAISASFCFYHLYYAFLLSLDLLIEY